MQENNVHGVTKANMLEELLAIAGVIDGAPTQQCGWQRLDVLEGAKR